MDITYFEDKVRVKPIHILLMPILFVHMLRSTWDQDECNGLEKYVCYAA